MRQIRKRCQRGKVGVLRKAHAPNFYTRTEANHYLPSDLTKDTADDELSDLNDEWCEVVVANTEPTTREKNYKKIHHRSESLLQIHPLPLNSSTANQNLTYKLGVQRTCGDFYRESENELSSSSGADGNISGVVCSSRSSGVCTGSSPTLEVVFEKDSRRSRRQLCCFKVNRKMSETEVLPPRPARLTTAATRLSAAQWPFLPKECIDDDDNGLVMRLDRRGKADPKSLSAGRKLMDSQITTPCVSPLVIASRLSLLTRSVYAAIQTHLLLVALCVGLTLMTVQLVTTLYIVFSNTNPPGMWFLIGSLLVLSVTGYKIMLSPSAELDCPSPLTSKHH